MKLLMDFGTVRLTIRRKLENGRLPLEKGRESLGTRRRRRSVRRLRHASGTGQLAMDGLARKPGGKAVQLHLRCFEIWTQERYSLLRQGESSAARPFSLGGQPAALNSLFGARRGRRVERDFGRC